MLLLGLHGFRFRRGYANSAGCQYHCKTYRQGSGRHHFRSGGFQPDHQPLAQQLDGLGDARQF